MSTEIRNFFLQNLKIDSNNIIKIKKKIFLLKFVFAKPSINFFNSMFRKKLYFYLERKVYIKITVFYFFLNTFFGREQVKYWVHQFYF